MPASPNLLNRRNFGFSLIELMVVIAIIAILAGIALPSYRNYVLKSTLKTAQADVVALSLSIENAYQRTLSYPSHDNIEEKSGSTAISTAFKSWKPASKTSEITFKLKSGPAGDSLTTPGTNLAGYVITATPVSSEISNCVIQLNNSNVRQMGSANNCKFATNNSW